MTSYRPGIATVPPPTLEKQLEVLAAAHGLAAQEDEAVRWRREEIAAVRRELGELARLNQVLQRQWRELVEVDQEQRRRRDPRLRSLVMRDASSSVAKASPDDPKHPGWPAGTPDGRGGKFRPRDGEEGAATATIPVAYGPNPYFPPVPPGYDAKTWTQGTWPNGNYYLKDPDGNTYTAHPEDPGHWRHWDNQDKDGNDQGRWPPNSLKPRAGQKRLNNSQSLSDPNGNDPPWTPNPFVPVRPPVPRLTEPAPSPAPENPETPPIRTNPIPRTFEFEPPIRIFPDIPIIIPE
jgi:hypothetical protein